MTIEVRYEGNPHHQRSFEVKVDDIRVADIPLAHLAFRDVAVNDFRDPPNELQVARLESALTSAFAAAYKNVDVKALRASAFEPREVEFFDRKTGTKTHGKSAPSIFAQTYLDGELSVHNSNALSLLTPDATVQKIHAADRAEQYDKLGYIV
jgi:hypothetical protein